MTNVLIYKVFRRRNDPTVNMHVCFDGLDIENVLYENEYKHGTCRVELVAIKSFVSSSVFDCMITYADLMQVDKDAVGRLCNKRLVAMLQRLEKKEASRHCRQGFKKWISYIGADTRLEKIKKCNQVIKVLMSL